MAGNCEENIDEVNTGSNNSLLESRRQGLCISCGRTIAVDKERSFCPDCKASGAQDQDIEKIAYKCEVSGERAIDTVRQWWQDPLIARNLEAEGKIDECRLQCVPFWKREAAVEGYVEGYHIESDEYRSEKIPMDQHLNNYLIWNEIACESGDIGIGFLRSLAGETVPYDECPGPAGMVTVLRKDAEEKSSKAIEEHILEMIEIPHITSKRLKLDLRPAVLRFYPIWLVRYSYSGRTYSATVDGVTGLLLAGQAPGARALRLEALASGLIVSIVLVAIHVYTLYLGQYFTSLSDNTCCCAALSAGVILIIINMISFDYVSGNFGHFRYGAVIAGGDAKDGYRPAETSNSRGNILAYVCMLAGLGVITTGVYFILKIGNSPYLGLVIIIGLIIYLVSCWHSYDNAPYIKGEVQSGTTENRT